MNEAMRNEIRIIQRELRELDKDKARLDWLDKNYKGFAAVLSGNAINPPTLREAIDEAMKESHE